MRALVTPAADPDVHVIPLRKDPAVSPRHGAELEDEHAPPAVRGKSLVREIALEGDAVHDRPAEPEGAGGRSVGSIRADDRPDLDPFPVDPQRGIRLDLDVDAVAELGACGRSLLDEERVEPAPLGHQAEGASRPVLDRRAVAQPAARARNSVLDHRLDRERQLPHRPHRQPAAAGLVAGERHFVH